ncbi:MAG: pyrroline-5-carboxylate reductase [Bacteroidota bacterium]|nr:pyrroline-5-carboxylate reductase [Odoribacter sp.]MDP3644818.1 pyrroline-5-carboxylate reductase [Bacteroidota bacterium]
MIDQKITIIGGGNIGGAIATGLIKSKQIAPSSFTVTDRMTSILEKFQEQDVQTSTDNKSACQNADIIILAIKPYQVHAIIEEIKPVLNPNQILISIAAGVGLQSIEEYVEGKVFVFRVMPNTAIAIQESMTLISTNVKSEVLRNRVLHIFDQLGQAIIISEDLMAAATVLASCGIAFALRYMRAAMQGGIEIGFSSEMAQFITAQTVKGATGLILESGRHPEQEIDKVTTPRGITITGLNEMEHKGFSSSLIQGLIASFNKIEKG